jgi:Flp pilus assembly pilin Flp
LLSFAGRRCFGERDRQRVAWLDRRVAVKSKTALSGDARGSVMVEYTVLLVLVAMTCAAAMVTLGAPLVRMFATYQTWLLLPFP